MANKPVKNHYSNNGVWTKCERALSGPEFKGVVKATNKWDNVTCTICINLRNDLA
jgi:hypothetical protein